MKVRLVQFSPRLGDLQANLAFHLQCIETAIAEKIELIVFPELSLSGYSLQDIVYDLQLNLEAKAIKTLKKASEKIDIVVGAPLELETGIIYNCAIYLHCGEIAHIHRKVDLPNFGIFEEKMIFKSGKSFTAFNCRNWRIGLLICREILFPQNSFLYQIQNCDLIIAISNSPFRNVSFNGQPSTILWDTMGFVISHFYQMHYIFVNRCGQEDGLLFPGGSFFAAAGSGIREKAPLFVDAILDVELDRNEIRQARITNNYLRDCQPALIRDELTRILANAQN